MRPTPFCDDVARPVEFFNPGARVMDINASKALERDLLDAIHDNMRLRWELEMTTYSAQSWKRLASIFTRLFIATTLSCFLLAGLALYAFMR